MNHITLHSNQSVVVYNGAWSGDSLTLDGSGGSEDAAPLATFTGYNALADIVDAGSPAGMGYGAIDVASDATLVTGGLLVSNATMTLSEGFGAHLTLGGTSEIVQGSTLTATPYRGYSSYDLYNTMAIDGTSTVNMDHVSIGGTGTFHLTGEDALLRMGSVGTGDTVMLDGGVLSLADGMSFLGTITASAPMASRMGPFAAVDVQNAMTAVQETFDRSSGLLELFDAQGGMVTKLRFAGSGDLYAAPTTGLATNVIAITPHPGGLSVTFTN